VLDGVVPLLVLPREFPENVFRPGITRVNLEFFLEFLLRLLSNVGPWIGLRQKKPAKPEMNSRDFRILL